MGLGGGMGIIAKFKKYLEACISLDLHGKQVWMGWGIIAILLGVAFGLMLAMAPVGLAFDLFFLPILVAVLVFKKQGLWAFVPAIVLYCLGIHQVNDNQPIFQYLSSGLIELLEWTMVALVTLFTIRRYVISERYKVSVARDFAVARTLQSALVPKDCHVGKVQFNGVIRQCRDIGGDYYYFRPFMSHYVLFCLGDVMGKGIPSSMIMAIIMGFFFEWGKQSPSPALILQKLNERLLSLWTDDSMWYTTIFYAVYDEDSGVLTYSSGAHHEAILLRHNGQVELLKTEGGPVGIMEELEWEDREVKMEPGDRVVIFTDGVTEARNAKGDFFELERAVAAVSQPNISDNRDLIAHLEKAVSDHAGGQLSDDMAILSMEVSE